jgi:hypothetical protein
MNMCKISTMNNNCERKKEVATALIDMNEQLKENLKNQSTKTSSHKQQHKCVIKRPTGNSVDGILSQRKSLKKARFGTLPKTRKMARRNAINLSNKTSGETDIRYEKEPDVEAKDDGNNVQKAFAG